MDSISFELKRFSHNIGQNLDLFAKEVMPDHAHLFVSCPPDYSIRRLFQILKGGSAYYIRKHYPSLKKYKHIWNRGTMYRSIGNVSTETIKKYIEQSNDWSVARQQLRENRR